VWQVAAEGIAQLYKDREFGKAMREIMALADRANQYIADKAPGCWPNNRTGSKT